jgi:hypothetical protein
VDPDQFAAFFQHLEILAHRFVRHSQLSAVSVVRRDPAVEQVENPALAFDGEHDLVFLCFFGKIWYFLVDLSIQSGKQSQPMAATLSNPPPSRHRTHGPRAGLCQTRAPSARRSKAPNALLVNISARHCHLTQAAVEALFGPGHKLTPMKGLYQEGQYAAKESVTLIGPAAA